MKQAIFEAWSANELSGAHEAVEGGTGHAAGRAWGGRAQDQAPKLAYWPAWHKQFELVESTAGQPRQVSGAAQPRRHATRRPARHRRSRACV